ncbi:MAG: hypothetical protein Q4A17_12615 [Thermoguttaceae bacterium]|nr:hypothetical protein [Thermoguttaceae bacterium]
MPNENVYQKYLGIAINGKPDHYTLLGVPFKESNPDTIAAAARQRKEILALQETPENQTEIQLLISEIKHARDCLLDDKARKQYEFDFLLNRSVEEKNASPSQPRLELDSDPTPTPPVPSPVSSSIPNPAPTQDPFGFMSAPAPQPAAGPAPMDPFAFGSAPAPQPAPPVNSYAPAPPRTSGGHSGSSSSRSKAQKKDNTPLIIAIVAGVAILLLLLWNIGYNSPRKQAERLYNQAVTAVNSYRYDEARDLLDRAIALDKQETYVKYRADIDRRQKNHEYTERHRKARESDDYDDYSF